MMTRVQIEQMYNDVVGYVVCPHGVSLPDAYCEPCGEIVKRECQDLALARLIYGEGGPA